MSGLKLGDVITFEGVPSRSWRKRLLVFLRLRKPPRRTLNTFVVTWTSDAGAFEPEA